MRVYKEEDMRVPIKSWCENPEEGALDQAKNLSNLPFIFKHIALMPDTHQGYGMPIGGVIACRNVVIPNSVGVDIGCGMVAVKTSLTDITTEQLKRILGGTNTNQGGIRASIPVGMNHNKKRCSDAEMPNPNTPSNLLSVDSIVRKEYESATKKLGTLGGGNHFIEIQKGDDNHIWFMIHSGSRNLGYQVANHYNKIAKELNAKWLSSVDPKWDLAFLPADSTEAKEYLAEMQYCLDFAFLNRKKMASIIKDIFSSEFLEITFEQEINIHHNYANLENHFGSNVWVHRKGATSAKLGQLGIIPGSQGTSSYIVKGLGNAESFHSCSHGAGRTMSRTKAVDTLDFDTEVQKLDSKGILHSIRYKKNLDEAPSAYKDIDIVMEEQKDLVEVVVKLAPLAVVKG